MRKSIVISVGIAVIFTALAFSEKNNPTSVIQSKADIGKQLFFDPILSSDKTVSCASCHKPEFAFADTVAFSNGVQGNHTARNTPSVMNMAMRDVYFFDGRAATLEAQVVGPVENPNEMNLPFKQAVQRIQQNPVYVTYFKKIFNRLPDSSAIVEAIAAYERTLETDQTPNDRWMNDDTNAMTAAQIRGRDLFTSSRTRCFDCHFTPDFTSDEFKNIGIFNGKNLNDSGRYLITKNKADIGKFKIPGLRNVAVTAPYMHNGMFATLEEVIDYYDNPAKFIPDAAFKDTILPARIGLTPQEKQDLIAYLHALTDDRFTHRK